KSSTCCIASASPWPRSRLNAETASSGVLRNDAVGPQGFDCRSTLAHLVRYRTADVLRALRRVDDAWRVDDAYHRTDYCLQAAPSARARSVTCRAALGRNASAGLPRRGHIGGNTRIERIRPIDTRNPAKRTIRTSADASIRRE